ncbi:hypothetical protein [Pseudonocardia nigra]|uniref:hypothetical protein n=1 Tax=Pseudonocardia nigra TaxID=1921578 RepID=UPI001C5FC5EA|nr:hypothetical protein [Pseudonocardia nigra]
MTGTGIDRGATAGLVGGAAWVLFGWGTPWAEVGDGATPTIGAAAAAAWFWLLLVVPAALLLVALRSLHVRHRGRYGRLGTAGAAITGVGFAAMGVGTAWELVTITVAGVESAVGYAVHSLGFVLLLPGTVLLGIAVWRAGVLSRAGLAGLALALTVPVGVGVAVLGALVHPVDNTGYWLALTLPSGIAWLVVATQLRATAVVPPGRAATAVG